MPGAMDSWVPHPGAGDTLPAASPVAPPALRSPPPPPPPPPPTRPSLLDIGPPRPLATAVLYGVLILRDALWMIFATGALAPNADRLTEAQRWGLANYLAPLVSIVG